MKMPPEVLQENSGSIMSLHFQVFKFLWYVFVSIHYNIELTFSKMIHYVCGKADHRELVLFLIWDMGKTNIAFESVKSLLAYITRGDFFL